MFVVSVMYPAGGEIDMDYYRDRHLLLVQERWGGMGLRDVRVLRGVAAPPGGEIAFQLIALLEFDSAEDFMAAAGAHGAEIMGDVANFTSLTPIVQFNDG